MTQTADTTVQHDIVARAGAYYRNARYLLVAIMLGMGLWFGYDGLFNWPRERADFAALTREQQARTKAPHTEMDIAIQRGLAFTLVPLAPLLLAFFLYRSRGTIRLSRQTLQVPGHPPVPIDAMRDLDKSLWDRKGIARITYELPDGQRGRLKLDDFVYQRDPIDEIVARIEAHLTPTSEQEPPPESPSNGQANCL